MRNPSAPINKLRAYPKVVVLCMLILLATLLAASVSGCVVRSTPPGPKAIGGVVGEATYTLLQWEEGLTIMIWDDSKGAHGSTGSGSTSDPVFRQSGHAESSDGRHYAYELETTDGKNALFTINGKEYDLARGSLFLISTQGAETRIRQLDRDLLGVSPTSQGCEAFGRSDPDVAALINGTPND